MTRFQRQTNPAHTLVAGCCALLLACTVAGCSVYMAGKQPDKKDFSVFEPGTPRGMVIAEIGAPVHTETDDGAKIDYFAFTQGYSTVSKTGRAVFHGAADVFTLGLWEVVGTPTEAAFDGTEMTVRVTYAGDDTVRVAEALEGGASAAD